MNNLHEEVKDVLFGIDLDYVVFDTLDSVILKRYGSSCRHQPNQTSDFYWYETDGIFGEELNAPESVIHQGETECFKQAQEHEYFNASYAIQYQKNKPTIIYIDEYRFNQNSAKDLLKFVDDINLEQVKRKKDQDTPIEELIEDAIKRMDK
jgi:hypothetical protein